MENVDAPCPTCERLLDNLIAAVREDERGKAQ
jgi:hypothetical protein